MWRPWHVNEEAASSSSLVEDIARPSTSRDYREVGCNAASASKNDNGTKGSLSKQSQIFVKLVHQYVMENKLGKGAISETSKILKLNRKTVGKIVRKGPRTPKKTGNKREKFCKVDNFTCDLIRREVYNFYHNGTPPTVKDLLFKLQEACEFPYKINTLCE